MDDINNEEIDITLTRKQLCIIRDSLKGSLVRENGMNFTYLFQITELGKIVEEYLDN